TTKKGVQSAVYDVTSAVLKNIETLGLDYLVAIGGDDTLSYAAELDRRGMKVIAVPKTMDNDVRNTEYCIGFSTAITRAMDAIERQRTTVGSHERIGLFRVFGRDAGYTALYTAYVTSVRCCIPEYKVDLEKLIELLITDKQNNPSNYSLAVLSEGAEWQGLLLISDTAQLTPELRARIKASFDEASRNEEHFPSTIDPRIYHVKLIREHLGDLAGKRILDVGCGKGRFARVFHEQQPEA